METNNPKASGDEGSSQGGGRPRKGRFSRRKVCPFLMDKDLVLDYKNMKVINRFVSETGKIVPRHVSGVSAKAQRKLARHIKRARSLGFIAPAIKD